MSIARDEKSVSSDGCGRNAQLDLVLSTPICVAGGRLSGAVLFHPTKPTGIRSVIVSIAGLETPAGPSVGRSLLRTTSFFQREVLLSGTSRPQFTHERLSQLWNAFLGRDRGRILSSGEHMYPFSISLPASLPPSYAGKAGTVKYIVTGGVHFPMGGTIKAAKDVQILAAPRRHRTQPVALTCPDCNGAVSPNEISIRVELPSRAVAQGESIVGRISVANPRRQPVRQISVLLENCEWVRLAVERELQRNKADQLIIQPHRSDATVIEGEFELHVPADSPPTVEGTTISVVWVLRITVDADPSVEFKTPLFVYRRP